MLNLAWNFQSRLEFSIPTFRTPHKSSYFCWVARLKFSISLEMFQILNFLNLSEKTKAYTTTTERKSFGELFWSQRETFQAGGGYKKTYKNQEINHIHHRNLSSVDPIFLCKEKLCTGAGRCTVSSPQTFGPLGLRSPAPRAEYKTPPIPKIHPEIHPESPPETKIRKNYAKYTKTPDFRIFFAIFSYLGFGRGFGVYFGVYFGDRTGFVFRSVRGAGDRNLKGTLTGFY